MNFYVRSGVKQGLNAQHKKPYFPQTVAELERILGLTVSRAWGCQDAASPLQDMTAANIDLAQQGTPGYRRQVWNIQEIGIRILQTTQGWRGADAGDLPGTASFLLLSYGTVIDGDNNIPAYFGNTNNLGSQPYFLQLRETQAPYRAYVECFDGSNTKFAIISEPVNKKVYGHSFLYAATDAIFSNRISCSATEATVVKGVWNGISAGAAPQWFLNFPPTSGSASIGRTRYAVYCKGAQLDTFRSSGAHDRLMRRLCWM